MQPTPANAPANEQPQTAVAPAAPAAPAATVTTTTSTATTESAVGTLPVDAAAKPTTFTVDGAKVTLSLPSSGAKSGASLALSVANGPRMHAQSSASSSSACTYTPPAFYFKNTSRYPIVITYADLKHAYFLVLPTACSSVAKEGFNVALGETAPSVVQPTTIGDVVGKDIYKNIYGLTGFVPRAGASYTFAPGSTTELTFIQSVVNPATGYPYTNSETTTFPPGQPTTVGSITNTEGTTTTVALTSSASNGGSASVACFNTTDPRYANVPAADITAFTTGAPYGVGVVKGACEFDSGSSTVTLGSTVTFTITNPDPDTAHGLFEGPIVQANCTQTTSGNTITATCPATAPSNVQQFVIGSDQTTEYKYFLFGNYPDAPAQSNLQLSPTWYSVAAGSPNSGYTFVLPAFATYPVTLKIDGDANNTLSLADLNPINVCGPNDTVDMTSVAPGTLTVNCNSGHQQQIVVSYNGGAWQYQHNGVANQNQDCDASCVAYASIDLYDATGTTLIQGDGQNATINGTSKALATINPIAIIDPVSGALEDPNGVTVNLPVADDSGNATVLKVTEANLNALNDTSIGFGLRQSTNGNAIFGLNVYYGGSSFVTTGASLPVGSNNGLAHIPYGVGLNIQDDALSGTGQLSITPPEPPGSHEPPQAFVTIGIPQGQQIQSVRRKSP